MNIVDVDAKRPAITPRKFREVTTWSVYKMSRETGIPLYSLYSYLKDPDDPKYREPKPFINRLFGELYQKLNP